MKAHRRPVKEKLLTIYRRLYDDFGPQHWWPGDSPFEVAVGAILTQNTNWGNVEKAILNLKRAKALGPRKLHGMPRASLAALIRPAGYFNVKAGRLKAFVDYLMARHGGSMARMGRRDAEDLRRELLEVKGVGEETADSILLYALGKPVFVIDAYTRRVLSRHGIMDHGEPYWKFQALFHGELSGIGDEGGTAGLYNEYHALFVMVGKTCCRPSRPSCSSCPLEGL